MKCEFCFKTTVGEKEVVILQGKGPVHRECYHQVLLSQRVFKGLQLTSLGLDELQELQEMLTQEINTREDHAGDVELFA